MNNAQTTADTDDTVWMWSRKGDYALLASVMLIGLVLRLTGVGHGIGFHPDERHMVMVTTALDENGMNPKSFAYGSFSYYAAWLLGRLLRPLWPDAMSYDGMFLMGRYFCTFMGIAAVGLTYVLGRLVYRRSTPALVAATLLSLNVFHIQLSRFFTADVTLTTLCLAALVALVAIYRFDRTRDYLLFGAFTGLATATKISSVFLTVPLAVAVFLLLARRTSPLESLIELAKGAILTFAIALLAYAVWEIAVPDEGALLTGRRIAPGGTLILALVPFALASGAAILKVSRVAALSLFGIGLGAALFVVAEPFAVLDFPTLVKHTHEQTSMVRGQWRPPYTIQYENTTPYLYHLEQMFFYTMRWPVFLAVAAGFAISFARAATQALRHLVGGIAGGKSEGQSWAGELILLAFIAVFFLSTAGFQVKFPRYMLPLYPPLFVFAGALFSAVRVGRTR